MSAVFHHTLANAYVSSFKPEADLEVRVAHALASTTTEDDTHPAPIDRFRLVHGIPATEAAPGSGLVWELFADPPALAAEMRALLESRARQVESDLPDSISRGRRRQDMP